MYHPLEKSAYTFLVGNQGRMPPEIPGYIWEDDFS